MHFVETIRTSYVALLHNKVRSLLTILGVVIGVFAVVTLVALVRGVQNYVQDQFDQLGSNLLFVSPGRGGFRGDPALRFTNNRLSTKNISTIRDFASDYVDGISPSIFSSKNVKFKGKGYFASVEGVNEEQPSIINMKLAAGRTFTKGDMDSESRVVILGYSVKEQVFGSNNPLGKTVQVGDKGFTVIGYMSKRSQDTDEEILIPYTTMQGVFDTKTLSYIYIKAKPNVNIDEAMKAVEIALYKDLKRDDFTVLSQKDLLNSIQEILGILAIGLASVAGISLLVGGIGIMNIMLVSVSERVSEIGLRKALGATGRNIATQFMLESIMLSVLGGGFGLGFSWLATLFAQQYFRAEIPWWATVLAFAFSLVVGVTFGTYPAIKASKLDPIEALRFE